MTTFFIIVLYAAVVVLAFIVEHTLNEMQENIDLIANKHNMLCKLVKEICESLNEAGIPAPEVRTDSNEE